VKRHQSSGLSLIEIVFGLPTGNSFYAPYTTRDMPYKPDPAEVWNV